MQRRGAGGAAPLAVIAFISLVSLLFVVLLQQLDSLPWDAAEFRSVLSVDEVDETQVISYIEPLPATRLDECLCHVRVDPPALPLGNGTGEWDTTVGPAVVVSLAALSTLASDSELSLEAATASALYGLCEGGVRSVYLVPGMGSHWTTRNIGAVAAAVAATRDLHGEPLPVSFVAVPPAAVQCAGVGDERMGVAAALAAGAPAVLLASHVSALKRRALFFEPALPRFLPQAQASPAPVPLRRHFLTCGGGEAPCMPPPDAPRLCSTWVRPLVQVGLCHPASLYSHGRHTTAAANSPGDPAVFPGPARLLEEVTPVVLRPGAALPLAGLREAPGSDSSSGGSGGPAEKSAVLDSPAAGTRPARAYAYNVLADRSAAWLLGAGFSAGGSPGVDVALHAALGWLGGNLTVLPPGRLCNVSSSWERVPAGVRDQDSADVALSAAADAAHAALLKLPALLPGNISADTIVVTARAALRATAAAGSVSALELADVERWLDVYAAAILHHKRQGGSPKHGLCADAVLRGAAVGAAASNGTARVTADMPALRPEARDALAHCFVDHHNVRDILRECAASQHSPPPMIYTAYFPAAVVMNFNDWGEWAPVNIKLQIELLGNFYPGIVTYTSKNYEPSVVAGIPALNLDYCEGGAGHHIGLKAQKCTGMALLRYPGHLGYVVSNDGAYCISSLRT